MRNLDSFDSVQEPLDLAGMALDKTRSLTGRSIRATVGNLVIKPAVFVGLAPVTALMAVREATLAIRSLGVTKENKA